MMSVRGALLATFSSTLKTVGIGQSVGMRGTNETFTRARGEFRWKEKTVFGVGTSHRMVLLSALFTIADLTLLADRGDVRLFLSQMTELTFGEL